MRYLFNCDTPVSDTSECDVLIVGSGLAGLYTALHIDETLSCVVISKEGIKTSNSWLAQGGIAAAISMDDTPASHYEDTLAAGAGLCSHEAVRVLVDEGPRNIKELVDSGVPFDLNEEGDLQITREGGHTNRRVVHAGGDATGRETVKALDFLAQQRKNISFIPNSFLVDILTDGDGVYAALIKEGGRYHLVATRNIVICTGGIGRIYLNSTNPIIATADGLAAASRAGAELENMEFIQFHPTGLYIEGHEGRTFLISEALRGEGGLLVNTEGERFMVGQHPMAELAPRDIVARGIVRELSRSGAKNAYIDITSQSEAFLSERFPTIYGECIQHGINMAREPIPVCPIQHFMIGGIKSDLWGRTNIPGLFACGEAAYTGVHGANRLASNSLLECLVFGRRAAQKINESDRRRPALSASVLPETSCRPAGALNLHVMLDTIQHTMNEYGYVIRNKAGLKKALGIIDGILAELSAVFMDKQSYYELHNIATTAHEILTAALGRKESVGAHYRED